MLSFLILLFVFHLSYSMKLLSTIRSTLHQDIQGLFFDCDGTIAETERDMTLVQFNEAFRRIPELSHIQWDYETYGKLLQVGASQARYTAFFNENGWPANIKSESEKNSYVDMLKYKKDEMFELVWTRNPLPVLPGVLRLIDEAIASKVKIAVCSNSNTKPVQRICFDLLGSTRYAHISFFCGDHPDLLDKKLKKPDPSLYLFAAKHYSLPVNKCVVIEDSHVGLMAAKKANMYCIVTPSFYTKSENFMLADLLIDDLDVGGVTITQ